MAADDFVLVTSEEWSEVAGAAFQIESVIGLSTLQNMINDHDWPGIIQGFTDVWAPPEGFQMVDARVINNGGLRFWVKLAPV